MAWLSRRNNHFTGSGLASIQGSTRAAQGLCPGPCCADKGIYLCGKNMVEAVGVEPTSENVTGQEPTYLVQFTRRELPRQIRVFRLERTRNGTR